MEKIKPAATIYPVRDVIAGREGPWAKDPREEEWMKTYLVLHRVPKEAVTVYDTPEELLEKSGVSVRCMYELIKCAKCCV